MSAYEEGQIAAEEGLRTFHNPYHSTNQQLEHVDWLLGFVDKNLELWDKDEGEEE